MPLFPYDCRSLRASTGSASSRFCDCIEATNPHFIPVMSKNKTTPKLHQKFTKNGFFFCTELIHSACNYAPIACVSEVAAVSFLSFFWPYRVNFWTFSGLIVGRTASAPLAHVCKRSRGVHVLDFSTGSTEISKTYFVILQCFTLIAPDFSGLLAILFISGLFSVLRSSFIKAIEIF